MHWPTSIPKVLDTCSYFFVVTGNVKGLVARGKLTRDKANKALSLLKGSLDYSDFMDVDMVIEVGTGLV